MNINIRYVSRSFAHCNFVHRLEIRYLSTSNATISRSCETRQVRTGRSRRSNQVSMFGIKLAYCISSNNCKGFRGRLPVWLRRDMIIEKLNRCDVLVTDAPTGSGKTLGVIR